MKLFFIFCSAIAVGLKVVLSQNVDIGQVTAVKAIFFGHQVAAKVDTCNGSYWTETYPFDLMVEVANFYLRQKKVVPLMQFQMGTSQCQIQSDKAEVQPSVLSATEKPMSKKLWSLMDKQKNDK